MAGPSIAARTFAKGKLLRRYPTVIGVATAALVFFVFRSYFQEDLFLALLTQLAAIKQVRLDEVFFFVVLVLAGVGIDQTRNVRRQRTKRAMQEGRMQAVRSTMATVHDVVNNALNNLVLIRLEADKGGPLSPETLDLFGSLIEDTAAKLREIDELETLAERTLGPGLKSLKIEPKSPL